MMEHVQYLRDGETFFFGGRDGNGNGMMKEG